MDPLVPGSYIQGTVEGGLDDPLSTCFLQGTVEGGLDDPVVPGPYRGL